MDGTSWRKSSASGAGAENCVELRHGVDSAGARDSKSPGAGQLTLGRGALLALLVAVQAGRLDHA